MTKKLKIAKNYQLVHNQYTHFYVYVLGKVKSNVNGNNR